MRTLALPVAPLPVACWLALAVAPLLGACSSPAPAPVVAPAATAAATAAPAASAAPVATATPALAACFPRGLREAQLHSTALEGDRLTVCVEQEGEQTHPCLALDLRTRSVERTASARSGPPEEVRRPSSGVHGGETSIAVCTRPGRPPQKRCDQIHPTGRLVAAGHGDGGERANLFAAYAPDSLSIAAILPQRDGKDGLLVEIATYSTRSLAQQTRRRVPSGDERTAVFRDPTDEWSLRWLGDRHLRLIARRCCGPDGSEALLDLRKGTFEALGDPTFLERVQGDVWLRGNSVRGGEAGGLTLTFMHLDSGQRATVQLPGRPSAGPEGRDIVPHRWAPSWVVAHTNPPGVAWVDMEREAVVGQMEFAMCP